MAGRPQDSDLIPQATAAAPTATTQGESRRSQWFDPCRDQLLPVPLEPCPVQDDVSSRLLRSLDRTPGNGLSSSSATSSFPLARRPCHGSELRPNETQARLPAITPQNACTHHGGSRQCSPSSQATSELASDEDDSMLPLKRRSSSAVNFISPPQHSESLYQRGWSTGDVNPFAARPTPSTQSYTSYTTRPLPPIKHYPGPPNVLSRNESTISTHVNGKRAFNVEAGGQIRCSGVTEIPGRGAFYAYDDGSLLPTHVDGEPVNPLWGLTKANRPRKRLPRACKACREEKSRCEPTVTGCVRCDISNRRCSNTS